MISVERALAIVLAHTPAGARPGRVPLARASGLTLARAVRADRDLPPFRRSAVDGFAVRSADAAHGPVELRVIEEVRAGSTPRRRITRGEAARLYTGAPVPEGADAVVMLEKTESGSAADRVLVVEPPRRGQHVARRGEDLRRGRVVLRKGDVLGAARLALLATVGAVRPTVWLPPRVAVLSTGDELVPASGRPRPGQIRESNGAMLAALAARAGGVVRPLGIAPDRAARLRARLREGLRADLLLVTGGVSVGAFDLVEPALERLGVRLRFDGVSVRPGKPTVFGTRGRTLVFALPGNPVSAFVTFELFVRPAFHRWMGRAARALRFDATLDAPVGGAGERETYLPALSRLDATGLRVRPIPWHGSGDLVGLGGAQALIVVPARAAPRAAGAAAQVLLLEESLHEALAGSGNGARAR